MAPKIRVKWRKKEREICRQSYWKHRATRRETYRRKYDIRRAFVDELKTKPCTVCGQSFPPCAMDFHHRNSDTKKVTIAMAIARFANLDKVLEELNKCELLCSNCHRIKTWGVGGTRRRQR